MFVQVRDRCGSRGRVGGVGRQHTDDTEQTGTDGGLVQRHPAVDTSQAGRRARGRGTSQRQVRLL